MNSIQKSLSLKGISKSSLLRFVPNLKSRVTLNSYRGYISTGTINTSFTVGHDCRSLLTSNKYRITNELLPYVNYVIPRDYSTQKNVQELHVIFGTETGSSEAVADMISEDAQKAGIPKVVIHAADDVSLDDLKKMNYVTLVTSTSGEGEFPPNAMEFGKRLTKAKKETASLSNMKFAILGLGDSSYSKFCEAARIVNEKFEQLGGQRIHPYTTIDEQSKKDPEEVINQWIQSVLKNLN